MSYNDRDRIEVHRRRFLGVTGAGLIASGIGSGVSATGSDDNDGDDGPGDEFGGGDGGDGDGDGFGGDDGRSPRHHTVTLVTGETVHVTERIVHSADEVDVSGADEDEIERTYAIAEEDAGVHVVEEPEGTYLIPHGVDTDVFDRLFFNVDYLVENGYTDEERDDVPILATYPDGVAATTSDVDAFGNVDTRTYAPINAVAAGIPKAQLKEPAGTTSLNAMTAGVERLHLDRRYYASLDESSPQVKAPEARDAFDVDGDGVRIAVIDTGIDADHPDLDGRVVYEENFSGDDFVHDGNGHGTHVAGIAAGDGTVSKEDDDIDAEYVGVAPGADLMNVKALGFGGLGETSDIMDAIVDAVENDADVINLSLGAPPFPDDPMDALVDWAHDEGVVVVSSSGNEMSEPDIFTVTSPATADGSIAVGASDDDEAPGFYSARGPSEYTYLLKPEVSAPGVNITAAGAEDGIFNPGGDPYIDFTGTSMAAPHVAGVAALLLEHDPDMDPDAVENAVVSTAEALEDRDVYTHGSGEVDAHAALDADLTVHDSVVNFGVVQEVTEETKSVTVENVGDESLDIDVSVTMRNETEDEDTSDNAWVDPESLTLEAGESAAVDLTVDTDMTMGMNAGRVTFETDDREYRSVFGLVRAIDVVLEKTIHEERDSALGDVAWAWSHDGAISQVDTSGFSADGTYNFPLFMEEATFTAWSVGHLPPDESRNQHVDEGDVVATIVQDVTVTEDDSVIEMDENDTVVRTVDTSEIDDRPTYEAFHCQTTTIELYGFPEERDFVSYTGTLDGDFNIFRTYFSPVDENDLTNIATAWLFYPVHDRDYRYDTEDVYWFYEPTLSLSDKGEEISATENVASDTIEWHRDREDQLVRFAGHVAATDEEQFPEGFRVAWLHVLHRHRQQQTWHRTVEDAEYTESFRGAYDNGRVRNNWWASRKRPYVASEAGEYAFDFNRYPLTHGFLPGPGTVIEPDLIYQEPTILDQHPIRIDYSGIDEHTGAWQVTHNGDVIDEDPDAWDQPDIEVTDVPDLEAGDVIGIHHQEVDHTRDPDAAVHGDYLVEYDPDGSNQPPVIADVHVPGVSRYNRVPPGEHTFTVEVAPAQGTDSDLPETVVEFEAYYAPGTAEETPFDEPDDWEEAAVTDLGDGQYEVEVEVTADSLDLAFAATNEDDNVVQSTTFGALRTGLPIDVKATTLNLNSNRNVVVEIEASAGFDPQEAVDVDSLRFGAPHAVDDGEGAEPTRHQTPGNGNLLVHFPVADTGYEVDKEPAVAKLRGSVDIEAEETLSGADGVEEVKGT